MDIEYITLHISNSPGIHLGFYGHNILAYNKCSFRGVFSSVITLGGALLSIVGMLKIENNSVSEAAILLSANSKILLSNNSQLRVANNDNFGSAIQLLVYNLYNTYEKFFKECKTDICDGRYAFQFVDDKGRYIAEADLEFFNASIILSNRGPFENTGKEMQPHYLLYNANLQDCTLTLREGDKRMNEDEKKRFFNLDSWDGTTIGSPGYYACTCDPTKPDDRNLWDCSSGIITTTVYPGLTVRMALVSLGDGGFVQKANFTMAISGSTQVYSISEINGCKELMSFEGNLPGQNYTLKVYGDSQLRQYISRFHLHLPPITKMVFNKTIIVQVRTICPTGFQISSSNNGTICNCSDLLSNHHFQCTIIAKGTRTEIMYKSSTDNYWMGYLGQHLVISNHCPSHYCNTVNSVISTTGVTTEDLNTTIQCDPNSNRQGLLCSQCTPGTSSQFGSFRCTQCTFAGLLLVQFGAVAGIILIVLLFLFNFTVLQRDIIGIAFYANVVEIMDEFLLLY